MTDVLRFEISWTEGMGYRVSVPNLLTPGQRLEVVPAVELDELDADIEAFREIWNHMILKLSFLAKRGKPYEGESADELLDLLKTQIEQRG